jgi:hypothetical protein
MSMLQVLAGVMAGSIFLGSAGLAQAQGRPDISQRFKDGVAENEAQLAQLQQELQASPAMDPDKVDAYLVKCLWVVYEALNAYEFDNLYDYHAPQDLHILQGLYIKNWPLNPLNGWQPIRVLSITDPYAPGDIVLQWCPPECYSFCGPDADNRREAYSRAMSIYGATPDTQLLNKPERKTYNEWVVIPAGALYTLDTFSETAQQTLEKAQRRAERAAKAAAEQAKAYK